MKFQFPKPKEAPEHENHPLPAIYTASAPTRRRSPRRRTSAPSYWAPKTQQAPAQTEAAIARLLLATLSPLFFATDFLGFTPEPAQAAVLKAAAFHMRIALNCNRQWGKSTIAAILIAHRLFTQPGVTVLIVAPAGRQSGETLRKVEGFLQILNLPLRRDGVNPHSLELPNGSRVVSLPAVDHTARGFSAVSMLLFDEAARIPDRIYFAFRPMLAVSRGDLIIISTPNGRRGFFYREMSDTGLASMKWFRHTGPVSECLARINQDTIDEEKAKGEAYFRQEWLCEFIETGKYVLDEQTIQQLIKREVEAYSWI